MGDFHRGHRKTGKNAHLKLGEESIIGGWQFERRTGYGRSFKFANNKSVHRKRQYESRSATTKNLD
jgi:hypothetical protein